jgi:hypothetical protein
MSLLECPSTTSLATDGSSVDNTPGVVASAHPFLPRRRIPTATRPAPNGHLRRPPVRQTFPLVRGPRALSMRFSISSQNLDMPRAATVLFEASNMGSYQKRARIDHHQRRRGLPLRQPERHTDDGMFTCMGDVRPWATRESPSRFRMGVGYGKRRSVMLGFVSAIPGGKPVLIAV